MIIEAITAYTAVKITWETLEILHLLHVGHETGKHGYKAGSFIANALHQQLQEMEYENKPLLKFVQGSETNYDFHATGNLNAIDEHNQCAKDYLNLLNDSLGILNLAKNYFFETHRSLERMVNALKAKDAQTFLSQLLNFKINFKSFKDEYKRFALKIEPPNRESLYISYISNGTNSVEKFNAYLESIDDFFKELKEIKGKISALFENDFRVTPASSDEENLSYEFAFEQLKQRIRKCMDEPELIKETIQKILPESSELADLCTEIAQISTAFKKIDNTYSEQTNLWSDDPNWLPMLTKKKQIEKGQRIFLHAMDVERSDEDEKLLIAQIFLRKFVSKLLVEQLEVEELAYEMACSLRNWQITKCKQLISLLITLERRHPLPDEMDGLVAWLKTNRKDQKLLDLFKEALVSPCLFSGCNLESAKEKLNSLFPDQDLDEFIKKYQNSLWGSIWKKSDLLIQLPKSFNTKILEEDCQKEDSSRPTIVSAMIRKLATAVVADLKRLQLGLVKDKFSYSIEQARVCREKEKAFKTQKNEEHDASVERIKQAKTLTINISSFANCLFPYLYQAKRVNPEEQKLQVPTIDDLSHIIYSGVDPNGLCLWKDNPKQLVHYFFPERKDDSKTKAWLYARDECQVNRAALFSDLFSYTEQSILLQAVKTNLSLQAIFGDNKKLAITTQSKALSGLNPETMEKTEAVFQELKDYYVLALVRAHPEYKKKLPFLKQMECVVKNFLKLTPEIGKDRLKSVQIFVGDLCVVFSAEDAKDMRQALKDFDKNYSKRYQEEKKVDHSVLYSLIKKMIEGPISAIRHQISGQLEENSCDPMIAPQPKEEGVTTEDKVKETAQVRAQEESKEKENERKEKEVIMEKVEHLEALTKQEPQTSSLSVSLNLTTSRVTLFSNPGSSKTIPSEELFSNSLPTKFQYGS